MKKRTKVAAAILGVLLTGATGFALWIGPRNVVGMLRYDTRREGALKVGDLAPDVELRALLSSDGGGDGIGGREPPRVRLRDQLKGRPLVLIFGSFT
jgi:hypothetical protein